MCSDSFFLGHIYIHACVWLYVSTWDLLHLLFYHGWHKAVYVLLYLEQVWELRCPAFPASMWPLDWRVTQTLSCTQIIGSSLTYAMCSVTASGTPFLQRGLASCFRPSVRDGRGGFALAWDLGAVFPYLLQLLSYCVTGLFSSSSNRNSSCCNTSSSACSYRCRECIHAPRSTMKHEQWHHRYHRTWVTEQLLVALGHVQTTDSVLKNSADKDVGAYRIRQQERW